MKNLSFLLWFICFANLGCNRFDEREQSRQLHEK